MGAISVLHFCCESQFLGELSGLSLDKYAKFPCVNCMLGSNFKGSERFGEIFSLYLESWCVWCELWTPWVLTEPPGRQGEKSCCSPLVSFSLFLGQGDVLSAQAAWAWGKTATSWLAGRFKLEFLWCLEFLQQFLGLANPKYFIKRLFQRWICTAPFPYPSPSVGQKGEELKEPRLFPLWLCDMGVLGRPVDGP